MSSPPLMTLPDGANVADATSALRRALAITYASRRMHRSHRNPDAHEDVNIEFSGLPYVCVGEVLCVYVSLKTTLGGGGGWAEGGEWGGGRRALAAG